MSIYNLVFIFRVTLQIIEKSIGVHSVNYTAAQTVDFEILEGLSGFFQD